MAPASGKLVFNGLNATTGRYLLPPLTDEEVGRIALRETPDLELLQRLKKWAAGPTPPADPKRHPVEGVNPLDLAEAGWGVVFAENVKSEVRRALRELLDHREDQAGSRYRGDLVYRAGETANDFLSRHHVDPAAPANPLRLPYYLLLVGEPEDLPYRFQYELDVQYAVGRLCFEEPVGYSAYANGVCAAERAAEYGRPKLPRRATFFGVKNPNDEATALTSEKLVAPLAASLEQAKLGWEVRTLLGSQADKAQLRRLLGGDEAPSLLFTASHGVRFSQEDERQLAGQGALVCQDWPGPGEDDAGVTEDHYFRAADLVEHPRLQGMIAFLFGCYTAGTPATDSFEQLAFGRPRIAPHAFVGRLPQQLLGHPEGGALAVVGHVDRAWSTAFSWTEEGNQIEVFDSALKVLLKGEPVGWAMEYFNHHYSTRAAMLCNLWEDRGDVLGSVDPAWFSRLWRATNDARNFVVFGDPAVRLAAAR